MLHPEPQPFLPCTISRDVQNFDLLIEDMEMTLGDCWGDLGFAEALAFLDQTEAEALEFLAIALDEEDEAHSIKILEIVVVAADKGIKTILVAEELSTATLHQLLRAGANEFIPYPFLRRP